MNTQNLHLNAAAAVQVQGYEPVFTVQDKLLNSC